MKPDYLLCDICKKIIREPNCTICVTIDRQMDPAGSYDDIVKPVDLCYQCLKNYVLYILDKPLKVGEIAPMYEQQKNFVNWVNNAIRRT